MQTPWGQSQGKREKIIPGVNFYSTSSHGGLKVSKRLNALIPKNLRNENCFYEEDCEYSIPYMFIQELKEKDPDNYSCALKSFKNWYPYDFEKLFQVVLKPGESFIKDRNDFYKENSNNWIVISAINHNDNMVKATATIGGKRDSNYKKEYFIDKNEYRSRGKFGYVIKNP